MTDLTIKKPLAPIYLLYGTESFIIKHLKEKIIHVALSHDERAFNLGVYDMNEEPLDLALEDADTLPFMGEKKVIIIENPLFLTSDPKKQNVEHNMDKLAAYLKQPSPTAVCIFIGEFEKLDKRKKIVKQLEEAADVRECVALTEEKLYRWLQEEAEKQQAYYTKEAHELLMAMVGDDLAILTNEMQKLALYVGEGGTIDRHVVEQLASRTLESNVFTMVNRIMDRKLEDAYQMLEDLLKQKEDPIKLTALVTRQIRLAFQAEVYRREGYSPSQVASRLKLHPYAVKMAWKQGERLGRERLKRALIFCADMDDALKTGKIDKVVGIQMLFERMASL